MRRKRLTGTSVPKIWNITGSFFWKMLITFKPLFHTCISWVIGNGRGIAFWFDSWDGQPLIGYRENFKPPFPSISLKDASHMLQTIAPQMQFNFTNQQDAILWNLTGDGKYTSGSIYRILREGGKVHWSFNSVWNAKVPPFVRLFGILILKNKILTRDVLQRRNVDCQITCPMCDTSSRETIVHLLFSCPYAASVWIFVQNAIGKQLLVRSLVREPPVQEVWENSWFQAKRQPGMQRDEWLNCMLCMCWWLWRQRNEVVFKGKKMRADALGTREENFAGWIALV